MHWSRACSNPSAVAGAAVLVGDLVGQGGVEFGERWVDDPWRRARLRLTQSLELHHRRLLVRVVSRNSQQQPPPSHRRRRCRSATARSPGRGGRETRDVGLKWRGLWAAGRSRRRPRHRGQATVEEHAPTAPHLPTPPTARARVARLAERHRSSRLGRVSLDSSSLTLPIRQGEAEVRAYVAATPANDELQAPDAVFD